MKMPFRLYRRGKTYYAQNNDTGEQESLRTKDKATASRLLNAKNESTMLMGSNLLVARAYMVASDPEMPKRTWKNVIDFIIAEKPDTARHRWISVTKDKALAPLWRLRVVETRAEQFLVMLKRGTVIAGSCDGEFRAGQAALSGARNPVTGSSNRETSGGQIVFR